MSQIENRHIKIWLDGKAVENSVKAIQKEMFSLIASQKKMIIGSKEYVAAGKKINQLKGVMAKHRADQKQVTTGWQRAKTSIGNFVQSSIGGFASVTAAIALIIGAGRKYIRQQKEIIEQLTTTAKLTHLQGEELEFLTAKVRATSITFKKDYDEILIATNAVSKQMGIDLVDAIDLVNKGFIAGADASDEFLDILKEYPTQFAAAGISAEEMISIISQQVSEGIYSDKGVDTIKEGTIRLREMTTATKEALESIGISSGQLEKDLRNNTITYFEAIQMVSEQLSKIEDQSPEVGTAIADIFGGAGEDAGLAYIESLHTINTSLETQIENLDETSKMQLELLLLEEEIQSNRTKNAEETKKTLLSIQVRWKQFIIRIQDLLTFYLDFFKNIGNEVQHAFTFFKAVIKAVFTLVKESLQVLIQFFETPANLIKALIKDGFSGVGDAVKEEKKRWNKLGKDLGEGVWTNFKKSIENARAKDKIKLLDETAIDTKIEDKDEDEDVVVIDEEAAQKEIDRIQKVQDAIDRVREELLQAQLEANEREIRQINLKYDKLVESAKNNKTQIAEIEQLRIDAIAAAEEEQRLEKEKADEKQRLAEEKLEDKHQEKILAIRKKYGLIDNAELMQLELDALKESYDQKLLTEIEFQKAKKAIIDSFKAEETELEIEIENAKNDLKKAMWETTTSHLQQLNTNRLKRELAETANAFNKEKKLLDQKLKDGIISEEQHAIALRILEREKSIQDAKDAKKAALFKIAIDTLVAAIIALTKDPTGTLSLTILAKGALAASLVAAEPLPAYEKGGFSLNKPHLAMFAEKGIEWNAPHWMVEDPKYANIIGYLETARRHGHQAGGFAGGSTTAASGTDPFAAMGQLISQLDNLNNKLNSPFIAIVNWDNDDTINVRDKIDEVNDIEDTAQV